MPTPTMTVQLVGDAPGWLGSAASVVDALAWPAVIVVCVILFRFEIRAVLSRVTSIGIGSVTAQVDQNLRSIEVLSAATASEGVVGRETSEKAIDRPHVPSDRQPEPLLPDTGSAAGNSAAANSNAAAPALNAPDRVRAHAPAVVTKSYNEWISLANIERDTPISQRMVEAFEPVDGLIRKLADRHGIPPELSTADIALALTGMGLVSESFGGLLGSQTQLRDMVKTTGAAGISEFQARQFIEQLGQTQDRLQNLLNSTTA